MAPGAVRGKGAGRIQLIGIIHFCCKKGKKSLKKGERGSSGVLA